VEATDTESGLQRSSLRGCLVLTDTRLLATGAAPVSPPPSPSSHTTIKTTKAVANEDGGGADGSSSFWARRNGSGSVGNRRHRHTALWGLVDPTGGTVYPHRCMPPHVTLVAGRRARRQRRRSGGGDNKALFGGGGAPALLSPPLLLRGTVQLWHGRA